MLMMKQILTMAAPLLLTAATCVGAVRQAAPDGPWIGEVTNTGDQPVQGVAVPVEVYYDAGELALARGDAGVCPSVLLPGERGAFEFTTDDAAIPASAGPPFDAQFPPVARESAGYGTRRSEGLHAVEVERSEDGRTVTVDIVNNGQLTLRDVQACAVARNGDVSVASVAAGAVVTRRDPLAPGTKMTFRFEFSAAFDGRVHVFPSGTLDAPDPSCCPAGAEGWSSTDVGPFSVMLPPDWAYIERQGTDSFVGEFAGDGMSLSFDYGWYSGGPPLPDDDGGYDLHHETIGGIDTVIATPRTPSGFTGLFVEQVEEFDRSMSVRLSLAGEALSYEQNQVALQIFRSLRFDRAALDGTHPW